MQEEKRPPGVVLYQDYEEHFARLEALDQASLVMAIFYYQRTGEEPEGLSPIAGMAFGFIRNDIDRDQKSMWTSAIKIL